MRMVIGDHSHRKTVVSIIIWIIAKYNQIKIYEKIRLTQFI